MKPQGNTLFLNYFAMQFFIYNSFNQVGHMFAHFSHKSMWFVAKRLKINPKFVLEILEYLQAWNCVRAHDKAILIKCFISYIFFRWQDAFNMLSYNYSELIFICLINFMDFKNTFGTCL